MSKKGAPPRGPALYLLIFCTEALRNMVKQKERRGGIEGVPVSRHDSRISHLFFVDDTLLLCRAKMEEIKCVHSILRLFEETSGLMINLDKSIIVLSENTLVEIHN
ncbi:UNVERIFIED_CONTAM: hypothetical protein Slati_3762400 [Sesamum latifolium]|uniref:Reverse transcriptase domain-containing protein n=1 Tax=Sesamum latifolium TaxID=2727402 RepID=A0AAW2U501_9LAMI